jgi:glycosyltransferase involved in cell wall biosynthesis
VSVNVLFASARDYLPDRVDGAILSVHTLLELLQLRGHECEALAGIGPSNVVRASVYRLRRWLTRRRVHGWSDRANGYTTYRAWEQLIPQLLSDRIRVFNPDLLLTQLEGSEAITAAAIDASVPVILFVRDAEFRWHKGRLADSPLVLLVSSSQFVSNQVAERLGRAAPYVYPIVRFDQYLVATRRPRFVTMVNPAKEKGIDVTLEVARLLPHREFLLVETWPLPAAKRRELAARLATLPNVQLRKPTLDMRTVYRETAVLLAPSQWNEAFGRVLLEAQISGIPVVASRIAGIPEAVPSGAILLAPTEPPERWAEAVEQLLADGNAYARLSDEARANAMRPEFDPSALAARFLEVAQAHVERCRSLKPAASSRE